jgi:hypothetical protein
LDGYTKLSIEARHHVDRAALGHNSLEQLHLTEFTVTMFTQEESHVCCSLLIFFGFFWEIYYRKYLNEC